MKIESFKDNFLYIFFMALGSFFAFSKILVFSKVLSVEDFGLYSLVLSIYIFYVFLGGLGLQDGLLKRSSMSFAVNDHKAPVVYLTISIITSLSLWGVIALCSIIFYFSDLNSSEETLRFFYVGFLLAIATILFDLVDAFLRSQQKFILFSVIYMFKNFSAIILGFFLASGYGAIGVILAEFICVLSIFLLTIIPIIKFKNFYFYRLNVAKELIKNGYNVMFTKVLRNLSLLVDRWFIALAIGATGLGYYSFAMIILTISLVLVGFLLAVKGPIWISNYKQNSNPKNLINNISSWAALSLIVLIFFSPIVWLYLDDILVLLYPQYANETVIIISFVVYLSLMAVIPIYLYDLAFIATSREGDLFKINIAGSFMAILLYTVAWLINSNVIVFAVLFFISRVIILIIYLYRIRIIYVS